MPKVLHRSVVWRRSYLIQLHKHQRDAVDTSGQDPKPVNDMAEAVMLLSSALSAFSIPRFPSSLGHVHDHIDVNLAVSEQSSFRPFLEAQTQTHTAAGLYRAELMEGSYCFRTYVVLVGSVISSEVENHRDRWLYCCHKRIQMNIYHSMIWTTTTSTSTSTSTGTKTNTDDSGQSVNLAFPDIYVRHLHRIRAGSNRSLRHRRLDIGSEDIAIEGLDSG